MIAFTSPQRLCEYRALPVASLHSYATTEAPAAEASADVGELPLYWSGVIGMESTMTGDGRLIEENALDWETPVPIRYVKEDVGGHQGAVTIGRILAIWRGDGGKIEAAGDFDHGSAEGREAARLVGQRIMNGVSMDLDSVAFEIRVAGEIIEEMEAAEEAFLKMLDGDEDAEAEAPERETDEEGRVVVHKMGADDEVMATTAARVRAATLVSVPAFAEAMIYAADDLPEEAKQTQAALLASAAPVEPPAAWFNVPEADGPTALTITDEGQVYGHLATWDVCHVADPNGSGVCVMAPKSKSGYAYFHTGAVKTSEGSLVPTGTIRFNTGHASLRASADSAAAHYDNTGLAGADIHAVDGKHGIWVAGALRPGVTPEQVRTLRASPLSGDWRYIGGVLELVGALAVNLPGFPVPRTQGLVASGELQGLVAAGMVVDHAKLANARLSRLSASDLAYLERIISRERAAERNALASRVDSAVNRRKVAAMAARVPALRTTSNA